MTFYTRRMPVVYQEYASYDLLYQAYASMTSHMPGVCQPWYMGGICKGPSSFFQCVLAI